MATWRARRQSWVVQIAVGVSSWKAEIAAISSWKAEFAEVLSWNAEIAVGVSSWKAEIAVISSQEIVTDSVEKCKASKSGVKSGRSRCAKMRCEVQRHCSVQCQKHRFL